MIAASPSAGSRLLFVLRHPLYLRNYEGPIRLLADRGHPVHLAFEPRERWEDDRLLRALQGEYPQLSWQILPPFVPGAGAALAESGRIIRDFLRYLAPEYAGADALRARAGRRVPAALRGALLTAHRLGVTARVDGFCAAVERASPPDPAALETLERIAPDVLVVSPLVDFGYLQTEYVKAARQLGIPSVHAVASWDNLTNKGRVQVTADLTIVWNEAQREEAVSFHGVPRERIAVTGAQVFDELWGWRPTTGRAEFCAGLELDPSEALLLYACSSSFIGQGGAEIDYLSRWLAALRSAESPVLRRANVVIRPHPTTPPGLLGRFHNPAAGIVVHPASGQAPVDAESKREYFDTLHHAAVVVGLNTSAFIDAAVVGRPPIAAFGEQFASVQHGTLHFRHLTDAGLLLTASDLSLHLEQLGRVIEAGVDRRPEREAFLRSFIRPVGLRAPAEEVAARITEMATAPRSLGGVQCTYSDRSLRVLLLPVGAVVEWWKALRSMKDPRKKQGMKSFRAARSRSRGGVIVHLVRLARVTIRALGLSEPLKRHVVPHLAAVAEHSSGKGQPIWEEQARDSLKQVMRPLRKSDAPILVGPWLSEVGYEVLYWIPFLRHVVERYELDPARLVAVSRGGTQSWYEGLCDRYVDVLDLMSAEEFRQATEARWAEVGGQKQSGLSGFDDRVIALLADRTGLSVGNLDGHVLHPSAMYNLFRRYWRGGATMKHVLSHLSFGRLPMPPEADLPHDLPDEYIAAKFYFRPSFPDSEENRRFVRRTLDALSEQVPVVLLHTGLKLDDHPEFSANAHAGLIHALDGVSPARNLAVQSAVISRAKSFVGTYGGLSYLAPMYGVDTVAFHSHPEHFLPAHRDLAGRMCQEMDARLHVLDAHRLDLLGAVIDAARAAPRPDGGEQTRSTVAS